MNEKSIRTAVMVASVILLCMSSVTVAGDFKAAVLANPCAGCHGTDGASPGPIPPIKGMSSADMVKAMKAFRSGERTGTVMNRIAKGYTDDEIELMAKHFAAAK